MRDETYAEYCQKLHGPSRMAGIDKIMSDDQLDVIVGTPTGRMITVASCAGYPVGNVPLGYAEFDGRPLVWQSSLRLAEKTLF
jgi:amidase